MMFHMMFRYYCPECAKMTTGTMEVTDGSQGGLNAFECQWCGAVHYMRWYLDVTAFHVSEEGHLQNTLVETELSTVQEFTDDEEPDDEEETDISIN